MCKTLKDRGLFVMTWQQHFNQERPLSFRALIMPSPQTMQCELNSDLSQKMSGHNPYSFYFHLLSVVQNSVPEHGDGPSAFV